MIIWPLFGSTKQILASLILRDPLSLSAQTGQARPGDADSDAAVIIIAVLVILEALAALR